MAVETLESDLIYRRIQNVARDLLSAREEVARLESQNTTFDLATNLVDHSSGTVTKAEALACIVALLSFADWFDNHTEPFETADGSHARRARLDPFLMQNL